MGVFIFLPRSRENCENSNLYELELKTSRMRHIVRVVSQHDPLLKECDNAAGKIN